VCTKGALKRGALPSAVLQGGCDKGSDVDERSDVARRGQRAAAVGTAAGSEDPKERPDRTGMFPATVSWETKLKMLRLAKVDAWHNGQTRFSRHLYRWETLMGLRNVTPRNGSQKRAQHKRKRVM